MHKTIWIVNHYAGGPELGTGWRHWELGRRWVRLGSSVRIFTASTAIGGEASAQRRGEREIDGVHFHFVDVPPYRTNGMGRLRNILAFNRGVGRFLAEVVQRTGTTPDIVIASSPQPLVWPTAQRFARRIGAKFVPEIRDIWPESLVQLAGMPRWHPLVIWCRLIASRAYANASCIASTLSNVSAYLALHGVPQNRCLIVPNGVDLSTKEPTAAIPSSVAAIVQRAHASNRHIVLYAGAIGIPNAVGQLIDAVAALPRIARDRLCCLVVGEGTQREALVAKAQEIDGALIEFCGALPPEVVCRLMRDCRAGFIAWLDRPLYRFGVSPQKLPLMLANGLPVIHAAPPGFSTNGIEVGWQCRAADVDSIAVAIRAMLDASESELEVLRGNCREFAKASFDWDKIAEGALARLRAV